MSVKKRLFKDAHAGIRWLEIEKNQDACHRIRDRRNHERSLPVFRQDKRKGQDERTGEIRPMEFGGLRGTLDVAMAVMELIDS